ncbi:metallophosphoesterase [Pseudomonas sp. LRF_L74]|uniref:metallophosphoesterase n=1 Tax=Pseudomonas sp. LRF_L74 TaxID=3369422 RepID=UPI003F63B82B
MSAARLLESEMRGVRRFERNVEGRDFAVGDVHGHFSLLQRALDQVGFDPVVDRLFAVGDLLDRGAESARVVEWLARPWFFSVQGNHEHMVVAGDRTRHALNGGRWFYALAEDEQARIVDAVASLPLAIEVETAAGLIGLVHADVPHPAWAAFVRALSDASLVDGQAAVCQWSRRRLKNSDERGVEGVRAVVAGHTPLRRPALLGNVYHIDTGGWLPEEQGYFTLLDLDTLQAWPVAMERLYWEVL